ncbi:MAG TPA: ABC transporter ATP-binding protein [Bacteroidota bacterium]|nr:ABC transporter ATP-binding protein [Bacteroidota bacterium]
MADAIVTYDLSRSFGEVRAVHKLNVSVHEGEMFGLVGPDGAGKTTAIRMLCGLLAPSAGSATVLGKDILKETDLVKTEIGYLSQRFSLYGDLTIDENIEFFAEINKVYDFKARREELLEFTRLSAFRERLAEKLSGGMKQKLALACTLIHRPRLLFLDEPTTGVDPVSRRDFWRILQNLLRQGISIVMTTPYLDEAERCTRVGLMHGGTLLRLDTPEAMKSSMSGQVLEIVCDKIRDAFSLLKAEGAVREVQAFGDRVNVIVDNAAASGVQLRKALETRGITVRSLRRIEPTLENVFISLLSAAREPGRAA